MTTLPATPTNKFSPMLSNLLGNGLVWLGLILIVVLIMFPFWWVIRTALTQPDLVYTNTSDFFPVQTTLLNFERVLGIIDGTDLVGMGIVNPNISTAKLNLWLFMRNSFMFSGLIMLGQTLFSTMAAYAFGRSNFPFRDQIFFVYLTGLHGSRNRAIHPQFRLHPSNWAKRNILRNGRPVLPDDPVHGLFHASVLFEPEQRLD
ncbi:MAG UNVERIFIED_CONTAM: hypothetical protein LVT10_20840 [Anaerolineae bacterium]|jgi:multiple sugar transport system permease protein